MHLQVVQGPVVHVPVLVLQVTVLVWVPAPPPESVHDRLDIGFVEEEQLIEPPPPLVHAFPQSLHELRKAPSQHVLVIDLQSSSGSCLYSFTPAVVQACIGVNVRKS